MGALHRLGGGGGTSAAAGFTRHRGPLSGGPPSGRRQRGHAPASASAIGQAHKAAGHPSPVAEKDMRLTIAGIARTDYRSQAQAAPLDVAALKSLLPLPSVPGWGMWCDGKRRLRCQAGALDIALVLLVSDAGLRRSEAADLTRGDAVRRPDGTGRITMCRSKTDATYDELGAWVPLRYSGELRRLPLIAGVEDDYSGYSGRVRMATRMGPTAPPPATSYAKDGGVPSPWLPAPLRPSRPELLGNGCA